MLEGEFEGVKAIHAVVSALIPRPIAYGAYTSTPSTYFYLAGFVPMTEEVPMPQAFCSVLANLHNDSIPLSPNGQIRIPCHDLFSTYLQGHSFLHISQSPNISRALPARVEKSHISTVGYEWKD